MRSLEGVVEAYEVICEFHSSKVEFSRIVPEQGDKRAKARNRMR